MVWAAIPLLIVSAVFPTRADHAAPQVLLFEDEFDRPDSLAVGNGWQEHGEAFPQEMRVEGGNLVVELLHSTAPGFPFTGVAHATPDYVAPWRYEVRLRVDALAVPTNFVATINSRAGDHLVLEASTGIGWRAIRNGTPVGVLGPVAVGATYDAQIRSEPAGPGTERITYEVNGVSVSHLVTAQGIVSGTFGIGSGVNVVPPARATVFFIRLEGSLGADLHGPLNAEAPVASLNSTVSKDESSRWSFTGNDCDSNCAHVCPTPKVEVRADPQDTGDPVALHSGEVLLRRVDLRVPSRGLDWEFSRRYRSRIGYRGPLGFNWDHNYHCRLVVDSSTGDILLVDGNGREDLYRRNPDGSYASPEGFYTRLEVVEGDVFAPGAGPLEARIVNRHGIRTRFRREGLTGSHERAILPMVEARDRNGNAMRFLYEAPEDPLRLTRVLDTYGREYAYLYDAEGRLVTVRDFLGREIVLTYDGNGDLAFARTPTVTGTPHGNDFPQGKTEAYAYSAGHPDPRLNHNLVAVIAPNEVAAGGAPRIGFAYDGSDRATIQQVGNVNASGIPGGGQIFYAYAPATGPRGEVSRTTVTDRAQNETEYLFDLGGRSLLVREHTRGLRFGDPAFYETEHFYNGDGELVRTVHPEGNEDLYEYAAASDRGQQGNLLSMTRLPGPRGGAQAFLKRTWAYEPVFNHLREAVEERGNDPSYVPQNGGAASPGRYATRWTFDYQEGSNLADLAAATGRSVADLSSLLAASGIPLALSDQNGDGVTTGPTNVCGNPIREDRPTVHLPSGSPQAAVEGDGLQESIWTTIYNRFGQAESATDAEENVVELAYYPEADPDGDGQDLLSVNGSGESSDTGTGGYMRRVTRDAGQTTRSLASDLGRESGRDPTPTAIKADYLYNPAGNVTGHLDARGVLTVYVVNELNEVVEVRRAASVAGVLSRAGGLDGASEDLTGQAFGYRRRFFYDFNGNTALDLVENRDGNTPDAGAYPGWIERSFVYDILDNPLERREEAGPSAMPASPEFVISTYRYHANELPARVTAPEGNIVETAYDERDLPLFRVVGLLQPAPSVNRYFYDGNRNLTFSRDSHDNNGDGVPEFTEYRYDGYDRMADVVDAAGGRTTISYDPAGEIVAQETHGQPGGPTPGDASGAGNVLLSRTEAAYDERGRGFRTDEALFVPAGVSTRRPAILLEGTLTPGDGKISTRIDHDRLDREVFQVEDDLDTYAMEYDGASRTTRTEDPEGNEVLYGYDDEGNGVRVEEHDRSPEGHVPPEAFATVSRFDSLNRWIRVTDNEGHTRRAAYDSRDNPIETSDAQGPLTAETVFTIRSVFINAPGNTTRRFVDGLNREVGVERVLREGGQGGNPVDTGNPSNPDGIIRTESRWDGNSRLAGQVDDNGNLTTYGYDAHDRRTRIDYADGTFETVAYDRDDNPVSMRDANGTVRACAYDALDRIASCMATPAPGVTGTTRQAWQYDGRGLATLAFDNNEPGDDAQAQNDNAATAFAWDSRAQLLEEVQYVGDISFAPAHLPASQLSGTNPGLPVSSDWESHGLRVGLTYPDGRKVQTTYDGLDRPKGISNASPLHGVGTIAEYDYIGPGRVLERRYGNGTRLSFHEDGADTGYDGLRRPVRLKHQGQRGRHGHRSLLAGFEYGYDREDNRRFERRLHEGCDTGDAYGYDSAYRLVDFLRDVRTPAAPTAPAPEARTWRLDGPGNWRELAIATPARGHGHDRDDDGEDDHAHDRGRGHARTLVIQTHVNQMNEYDATSSDGVPLVPDDDGQPDFGDLRQAHDKAGNLVAWDSASPARPGSRRSTFTATYDFRNRLRTVRDAAGHLVATYSYDAVGSPHLQGMGRRVRRTVAGRGRDPISSCAGDPARNRDRVPGPPAQDVVYLWDGPRAVEERDARSGQVLRQYVDGLWIDEHLLMDSFARGEEGSFFYHENSQGWVHALSNPRGRIVERVTYDAYGEPRFANAAGEPVPSRDRSAVGNPYLYAGARWDPEVRLYQMRHRAYRPETGRFVQREPLGWGFDGGWYQYVGGNPVNGMDPEGLYDVQDTKQIFLQKYGQTGAELLARAFQLGYRWDKQGGYQHPQDRPWSVDPNSGRISLDSFYDDNAAEYLYEALRSAVRAGPAGLARHGELSSAWAGNPTLQELGQRNREAYMILGSGFTAGFYQVPEYVQQRSYYTPAICSAVAAGAFTYAAGGLAAYGWSTAPVAAHFTESASAGGIAARGLGARTGTVYVTRMGVVAMAAVGASPASVQRFLELTRSPQVYYTIQRWAYWLHRGPAGITSGGAPEWRLSPFVPGSWGVQGPFVPPGW